MTSTALAVDGTARSRRMDRNMNQAIDGLVESARLLGCTQAKRGFGVYTQDDAIMERSCWEGVEARAKAIRDEVAALKAERDATIKDANRIDWYEKNKDAVLHIGERWYSRAGYGAPIRRQTSFRDAVDAASVKVEGRKE